MGSKRNLRHDHERRTTPRDELSFERQPHGERLTIALKRYADRCLDRRGLLDEAVLNVIAACRAEASVREAFVFGSYATSKVGPTSDLDVLVVRDTELGIIDRVIDLRLASLSRVTIDMVVVTPYELANTFSTSSFGRVTASLRRGFGFKRRSRFRNRR